MTHSSLYPLHSWRQLERVSGLTRVEIRTAAATANDAYLEWQVPKPGNSGKIRHIEAPDSRLMYVLRRIDRDLMRTVTLPESMLGGVRGKSIIDNAHRHANCRELLTIDVKDYFPSLTTHAVRRAVKRVFGAADDIADALAALMTRNGHVPQGAPTSTSIANLCMLPVEARLAEIGQGHGLTHSIWVDDIAFSGRSVRCAIGPVVTALEDAGLAVRAKKVHVMGPGTAREITGTRVSPVGVPRAYYDALRKEIVDFGPSASAKEVSSIRGKIAHVVRLQPRRGEQLAALCRRIGVAG